MSSEELPGSSDRSASPLLESLIKIQPWIKFFAILFFISTGLLIVASISSLVVLLFPSGRVLPGYWNALIPIVYLALAGIYFLFGWKIRSVDYSIREYLNQPETKQLTVFLEKNHSMWRLFGLVTLLLILLQMVIIVIVLAIAAWVH